MTRLLSRGSLIAVLVLGFACSSERPTVPSAIPTAPTSPPLPPSHRNHSPRANSSQPTVSTARWITLSKVRRPDRNTSSTTRGPSRCDTRPSRRSRSAHTGRTALASPFSSAANGYRAARTRWARSRGICWKFATARSCSMRTTRTPSTGDSSNPPSQAAAASLRVPDPLRDPARSDRTARASARTCALLEPRSLRDRGGAGVRSSHRRRPVLSARRARRSGARHQSRVVDRLHG